jgi:hypothetical protein
MADALLQSEQPFTPPTAEQVQAYLDEHPPRAPSRMLMWLMLVAMGFAFAMMLSPGHPQMAAAALALMGGLFFAVYVRARRLRELDRRAAEAVEWAMLRQFRLSFDQAWLLLPRVVQMPPLHGRVVALIAHGLDQLKAWDSALVAYDELIKRLPDDHPGATQFRVRRAIAHLFTDRLADADDELRRVRNGIDRFAQTAVGGAFRLAELFQRVRTNHFADATEFADTLVADLRPLGVEAGYGHALMALSFHQLSGGAGVGVGERRPEALEEAQQWWRRATILLPVERLVHRFAEITPLTQDPRLAEAAVSPTPPGGGDAVRFEDLRKPSTP